MRARNAPGMGPSYTTWLVISRAKDVPGEWVAHALDFDVVTQGSSAEHAREMAIEAVGIVLTDALSDGRSPFEHRAPEECWRPLLQILEHGRPLEVSEFRESLQAANESSVFAVQMFFTPQNALEKPKAKGYAAYVAAAPQGSTSAPASP
jgi:predicted RNase H-like HicB family nuclease